MSYKLKQTWELRSFRNVDSFRLFFHLIAISVLIRYDIKQIANERNPTQTLIGSEVLGLVFEKGFVKLVEIAIGTVFDHRFKQAMRQWNSNVLIHPR